MGKKRKIRRTNSIAIDLRSSKYRKRIVTLKVGYDRKSLGNPLDLK